MLSRRYVITFIVGSVVALCGIAKAQEQAKLSVVAAFSILIIVLIFLPTGLLGRPEVEKV